MLIVTNRYFIHSENQTLREREYSLWFYSVSEIPEIKDSVFNL